MKFRPCIDLHKGQVKQIVGSTLTTNDNKEGNDNHEQQELKTNFVSNHPASYYAKMYEHDELYGGHIIMLGDGCYDVAKDALLSTKRNLLQIGGGININNCMEWIDYGASHVIITSYIFVNGNISYERLNLLKNKIGKEKLVLDLSCRKKLNTNDYYVVTDKWQTYTNLIVNQETLHNLSQYCDEFLIHGVDVEGKQCGILNDLIILLTNSPIPVTYAGGIRNMDDIQLIGQLSNNTIDYTIGSALDIFGGKLSYNDVVQYHHSSQNQNQQQETS